MRGQEDIIRERFTRDLCGSCGAARRHDDIMMLAHRGARWMVLVTCWRCHHRGIFIATFPAGASAPHAEHLALDSRRSPFDRQPSAHDAPSITTVPLPTTGESLITRGDVDAMRQFLSTFNGDFHALFGGEPS